MQHTCPNCRGRMEVPDDASDGLLTCPACGLGFAPDASPTVTMDSAVTDLTRNDDSTGECPKIGRFEILSQIGRGGSGTVYRAYDPGLGRKVAVKVPRHGEFGSEPERERFLREARNAAQLHHAAIVPIFDMGESDGIPYIVSELIEGSSLDRVLRRRKFSFREAAELVAAVADGLHCAHQSGVIHRDIKPSNIMIAVNGQPRIMDFGLARQASRDVTLTMDGEVLGTPAYMSPEQAAETHGVDYRSDIYSLGIVLFELLTGERPFRGNPQMMIHQVLYDDPRNPRSLNNYVPTDLETICLKAIDKDPARRYQSAKEFEDDLRSWLRGEPIQARRIGTLGRAYRWCRRNPSLAAMTVVSVFLLILLAVGSTTAVLSIAAARQEERQARVAAASSLQESHQAFDQYYKLISETPLLDQPGTQPVLQDVLATAMNYCRQFLAEYADRPGLDAEVSATYMRLSMLQSASGDTDGALETVDKAAERIERFLARRPTLDQLAPLASGLFRFPRYARHGALRPSNPPESVRVVTRVVKIWDQLVAEHPEVVNFEHDRAGMYYYLDLSYRADRDWQPALRAIEKAIEISARLVHDYPESGSYKRELSQYTSVSGDVYAQMGRPEDALKEQVRATAIDPSNPRPFIRVAATLLGSPEAKQHDPQRAIEFAKKAIAIEPTNGQYWHTLGTAQYRARKWRDALASFGHSMELQNYGDGFDWYFSAMVHWQLGEKDKAIECFKKGEAWKEAVHLAPYELEGIDKEAAQLLGQAGQTPKNDLDRSPKAALSH